MDTDWVRYDGASRTLRLSVYVQPNARRTGAAGLHGQDLKIRVAAPAVDNKANLAVCRFFAEVLAVPPSSVRVRSGASSRRKTLEIADAGADLAARARALGSAFAA